MVVLGAIMLSLLRKRFGGSLLGLALIKVLHSASGGRGFNGFRFSQIASLV